MQSITPNRTAKFCPEGGRNRPSFFLEYAARKQLFLAKLVGLGAICLLFAGCAQWQPQVMRTPPPATPTTEEPMVEDATTDGLSAMSSEDLSAEPGHDPPQAPVTAVTEADAAPISTPTPVEEFGEAMGDVVSDEPHEAVIVETSAPPPTVAILLPSPTPTPAPNPMAAAGNAMNVRGGPGTVFPVVGGLESGVQVEIIGRNPTGDWWQVRLSGGDEGWVFAPLVETTGDVAAVVVVDDLPTPPPIATPAAVAQEPMVAAPLTEEPIAPPTDAPPPAVEDVADGPVFRIIEKRLWDVYENGGTMFGDSVNCGEKRNLLVVVVDPNGVRINGVSVQVQYGAREIFVTRSQGKGDGAVEFVLGLGQDVAVLRDVDGREAASEVATGLSTDPRVIPNEYLIRGGFCTDHDSCERFKGALGCYGHHSWTVIFERSY